MLHTCRYAKFHCCPRAARKVTNGLCRDLRAREWLLTALGRGDWLATATWLVNRSLTERAGPWDERLTPGVNDDGEYFCRMVSMSSGVKFHEQAVSYYRIGNPGSLSRARSPKALASILLSVNSSIDHLLELDEGEMAQKAALAFLQYCVDQYQVDDHQAWHAFLRRARELGGNLRLPIQTRRFRAARALLGENIALRAKIAMRQTKWTTIRQGERIFSLFSCVNL